MEDNMMRPRECAQLLRLSEKTLAMRRSNGTGPPYSKAGSRILYSRADVEAWVARYLDRPQAEPQAATAPQTPVHESPRKPKRASVDPAAWRCLCGRIHAPHIHTCPETP